MRWLLPTTCLIACWAAFPDSGRAQLLYDPADGPVCRRPEVLDVVWQELHRRIVYAGIDPASVQEEPAAAPDAVRCTLCLNVRVYDAEHDGMQPVPACQLHAYEVRVVRAGFVVGSID